MDFQLYDTVNEGSQISNRHFNSEDLWNIPSDDSMDNNNEYYGWTNDLKIDEEKFSCSSTNNDVENVDSKASRKRKLPDPIDNLKIKSVNSYKSLTNEPFVSLDCPDKQDNAKKNPDSNGSSRMPAWQMVDISDLNTDLEGSLTGLGSDLSNNTYNVSEAILGLPGLPAFKQEASSPTIIEAASIQQTKQGQQNSNLLTTSTRNPTSPCGDGNNNQSVFNNTLNHLLGNTNCGNLQNVDGDNPSPNSLSQDGYNVTSTSSYGEDSRFQYVLAAATSIATKINEDTLTYLNQGQSYEIKLKKLGDLSTYRGKLLKTVIRVCFHERRLQYMEKEQMALWQNSRPGDRILEVDVPLSYGLYDVSQPTKSLNTIYFSWDPTKEVGVYIKVNCISTEFTPKKHGGEKGVPFRIQVETYPAAENIEPSKRLHAAACQVKVFKLKGGDRKHKQDREKILKRPISEQEKYQPSYECTVLNDIPLNAVVSNPVEDILSSTVNGTRPLLPESNNGPNVSTQLPSKLEDEEPKVAKFIQSPAVISPTPSIENGFSPVEVFPSDQLSPGSNPQTTVHWLTENRFNKYLSTFSNFSGADMMRMSRDDLIQICGHADGIRLYNALHSRPIPPKLTIYISYENSSVFTAIFLFAHCNVELMQKLALMCGVPMDRVKDMYMQGPQSIRIQLNNDVIRHMRDEAMFILEVMQENGNYIFLLKPVAK